MDGPLVKCVKQRRLANAGLSGHEDYLPLTTNGGVQMAIQVGKGHVAAYDVLTQSGGNPDRSTESRKDKSVNFFLTTRNVDATGKTKACPLDL
jgi:hypothetical protein